MPNTTDQHSWYYPADGERDYEDTFETFFQQLDSDVEIRDADANKSNYDPEAGAKFVATDTEDVYLGDGNTWNHLVSTGKNPTFNSVNTESISIGEDGPATSFKEIGSGASSVDKEWREMNTYDIGPDSEFEPLSKDTQNPLLTTGGIGEWDETAARDPDIVIYDDTYYMYYSGRDSSSVQRIGLATSNDGVNWTKETSNPIIDTGTGWESDYVRAPCVLKVGPTWHMFYQGGDGATNQVGHATSSDGITWTKDGNNPVFSTSLSGWDDADVIHPSVFYEGGKWHMFYSGNLNQDIGYAFSTDGPTNWTRYNGNPLLESTNSGWNYESLTAPTVERIGGTYHMVMSGRNGPEVSDTEQIGHYWSKDLLNWIPDPNNPIIEVSGSGWDDTDIGQPCMVQEVGGSEWYVYYAGSNGTVLETGRAIMDYEPPTEV